MAVTNFQYITRMNSGFKVYILEGQPHLRSEDRFRHVTSERMRMIPARPIKRKHSSERGLTLEERRERVLSKHAAAVRRSSVNSVPESPSPSSSSTSSFSPASSPLRPITAGCPIFSPASSPLQLPACSAPMLDEPLALIKKPRRDSASDRDELTPGLHAARDRHRLTSAPINHIQMRPSVITCVPSATRPRHDNQALQHCTQTTVVSGQSVEEHFQRSLGPNYHKAASPSRPISMKPASPSRPISMKPASPNRPTSMKPASPNQPINAKHAPLSIGVSVDDHFAKALGDKWRQLKRSSSSSSSSSSTSSSSSSSLTHTSPSHTHIHTPRASTRPDGRSPTLWIIK